MADVTVARNEVSSGKITLVANEASTITFAGEVDPIEVISDGSAEIWYTFGSAQPAIEGKRCYYIPAGVMSVDERDPHRTSETTINLISDGTPTIVVQRGSKEY